jgi:hypothetical protein
MRVQLPFGKSTKRIISDGAAAIMRQCHDDQGQNRE